MKTILVPLDGSALAEQVRLLAPLLEAWVHLLRGITVLGCAHPRWRLPRKPCGGMSTCL